jgi:hypothetical protein
LEQEGVIPVAILFFHLSPQMVAAKVVIGIPPEVKVEMAGQEVARGRKHQRVAQQSDKEIMVEHQPPEVQRRMMDQEGVAVARVDQAAMRLELAQILEGLVVADHRHQLQALQLLALVEVVAVMVVQRVAGALQPELIIPMPVMLLQIPAAVAVVEEVIPQTRNDMAARVAQVS